MRLLKHPGFWIALLLVAGAALGSARWLGSKQASVAQTTPNSAAAVIEMLASDVTTVQVRAMQRSLAINGTLRPLRQASVKARAAGELRELLVREGEAVRSGQLLARIDPTEAQLRVRQAADNVAAANGQLDIARKNRDNSKSLADRGFISPTAAQNADAQYASAKATVDASSAALDLARKALADTEVRAPLAGTVSARLAQPGEKVAVDARLLEIVDLRSLEFEASVPAADIARVRVGQQFKLRPEGVERTVAGKIVRINPANVAGSRSYLVYGAIADPAGLRAGLFAQATLVIEQRDAALTVPATALRTAGNATTVYVIENGSLAERSVKTGLRSDDDGGLIEIVSGLSAGQQVVRVNLGRLMPGRAVKIVAPQGQNAGAGS